MPHSLHIFFQIEGRSQCLPTSILLHPIVLLRRTACVFPVSLSKFHFFDYLLEFNISSVTDYVCLSMPTVSTQRYTAWTSFQAGLTCPAVGNAVSRDPEAARFFLRICLSYRGPVHLRSCPLRVVYIWWLSKAIGYNSGWLWKEILPPEFKSIQSFTLLSYLSLLNKHPKFHLIICFQKA